MFSRLQQSLNETAPTRVAIPSPAAPDDIAIDTLTDDYFADIQKDADDLNMLLAIAGRTGYRISAADAELMKTHQLLAGTTLQTLATETYGGNLEAVCSLETLIATVKEKAKSFYAKLAGKTMSAMSKVRETSDAIMKKLQGWLSNKSVELSETVRTHPYATAAAAVATITTLVAIVSVSASVIKTGNLSGVRGLFAQLKWPVKVELPEVGEKLKISEPPAETQSTLVKAGGWTLDKLRGLVTALSGHLSTLWSKVEPYALTISDHALAAVGLPIALIDKIKDRANHHSQQTGEHNAVLKMGIDGAAGMASKWYAGVVIGAISYFVLKVVRYIESAVKQLLPERFQRWDEEKSAA